MDKKRRDFSNCEIVDLIRVNCNFTELVAVKTDHTKDEGLTFMEYLILPKYGQGIITTFEFEEVTITISRYKLSRDLIIYNKGYKNVVQLSFLLEGEKIISLKEFEKDILLENQESFLADITSFNGYSRISGNKIFKEFKIRMSRAFLYKHGFTKEHSFKELSAKDLIVPVTNDLLSVLNDLEEKGLKGITRKIYLEAKVLELLALQLENYKNVERNGALFKKDKTIKKLYEIKQILKENLYRSYSIKELSREVALNENILKSEFKRVFSCSIKEYEINEKMGRAKELLYNSQFPIYQVAEEIGYKNATHFSAAFKKYFGKTPKKFRSSL